MSKQTLAQLASYKIPLLFLSLCLASLPSLNRLVITEFILFWTELPRQGKAEGEDTSWADDHGLKSIQKPISSRFRSFPSLSKISRRLLYPSIFVVVALVSLMAACAS